MTEPIKFVNPFTFTKGFTVSSRDEPYLAYVKPPDVIDDETVVAIVQAVTQVFTELAAAMRKQARQELQPIRKIDE